VSDAAFPAPAGTGAPAGTEAPAGADAPAIPEALPVLPLRDSVSFPDTLTPLAVGQERSIQLVNDVLGSHRMLVMVASRDPEVESPGPDQLHEVGVVGLVARMLKVPDGTLRILVQGAQRVKLTGWVQDAPYLVARLEEAPDVVEESPRLAALIRNVQQTFSQIVEEVPYLPEELKVAVANVDDPSSLAHLIAGALRIKTDDKQALLEERNVAKRLRRLSEILAHELEVISIGTQIQSQVQSEFDRSQREYVLRQQLKAIQEELGEQDESVAEANELREQLEAIELPQDVRTQVDRELGRLERLPPAAAEHGVIRSYLEWIASLPWATSTEDNLDLAHAREVLDEDHYDIEKVKDRILEFLAVRKLKPDARGSILCFVGPPGVGKTSLGKSIARALGRNFERISAGGVRDEAEIRGHRRTYIGAMPGTIIRALRDAGSNNPLFMIDEIDKMGADYRGDPASAMLEVLDPEQNATFRDHYLDVPFDLSDVMFITTANTLDTVPGPLRDRMEVIQLSGYTEEEKVEIAKRYLVPRQIERNGLTRGRISFTDGALAAIVADYTREAGVRNLERELGTVCRKVARGVAEGTVKRRVSVSERKARELLGKQRFHAEARRRTSQPGVATGLAWTPVGGDVLFIEATAMSGSGKLTITGQLGEVMKESAQAALSYVRGHAGELAPGIPSDWFATHDIHVHVPAGAIPKDGPSAGITMATALVSLVSGRPTREDVAMTGEMTLTGQVLPIGGLKEKALAAQRHGIRCIVAPARNEADADEIPEHLRRDLEFCFVSEIDAVLDLALEPAPGDEPGGGGRSANGARGPRRRLRRLSPPATRRRLRARRASGRGLAGSRWTIRGYALASSKRTEGVVWQRRTRRPKRAIWPVPPAATSTSSACWRTRTSGTTSGTPTSRVATPTTGCPTGRARPRRSSRTASSTATSTRPHRRCARRAWP
jgi:ATP-dependent Lon protease